MDKKRVWTLYRVSTKSQVNADEDIPMQRNACHKFAEAQPNWEITNELYERGISGWKKSASDRDELTQIKEGAVKGEFDILLIFLSDRLGRRQDESPFVIEFLKRNNVVVHSVKEGELKSGEHTDSLLNYIRYWQAESESLKTSVRVKEQLKQMNEEGRYTGGNTPFGYKVYETDQKHWKKDSNIKELQIDEDQAKIVKIIFELSAYKNYGRHKIASHLNQLGYLNQYGKKFNDKFIWRLLNNPIYIGRKRYGVENPDSEDILYKTQPFNESLRIIDDEVFYKSQEMIKKRRVKLNQQNEQFKDGVPNSSKVLLSGLIKCGYCGSFMKTDYSYKDYKRKSDGQVTRMITYRYKCINGKNKITPHPKQQVGAKKVDEAIIFYTKDYVEKLDMDILTENYNVEKDKKLIEKEDELKQLELQLSKKKKNLNVLNDEVPKSLLGESSFSPDLLSKSIAQTESEISNLVENISHVKEYIAELNIESDVIDKRKTLLENWSERFDKADIASKKVMLSDIMKEVIWTKDKLKPIFIADDYDHVF